MKHILLILLLFATTLAGAQTVNIPDTNFKNALLNSGISNEAAKDNTGNTIIVDINNDGEIQLSEALQVFELRVFNMEISSLEGIEHFTNLIHLDCSMNSLSELDILALTQLNELICSNNNLSDLAVAGILNLELIYCNDNQITNLNLTSLPSLIELECSDNQLNTLDVSALTQLIVLECQNNNINTLTLGTLLQLEFLICNNNGITLLDLGGVLNLEALDCSNNELTSLNLSGLSSLQGLGCENNHLTQLNFTGLEQLHGLYCSGNLLTELDLSGTKVWRLSCSNNDITFINLKNGVMHDELTDLENDWSNNPLQFVCTDENELDIIGDILDFNNLNNVNVNTYCSFTPGGDYNTITGTVTFDSNQSGACDAEDAGQMFVKMNISNGTTQSTTFTNTAGAYNFYTASGNFTVAPVFENNWFAVTPEDAVVSFPVVDNTIVTENFCVTANGERNDIEVIMVPIIPAQPGQDAVYKIVYRNKGNQVLNGEVSCVWDPALFGNIILSPPADVQAAGDYTWYYSNLLPFESREIIMILEVNEPTDTTPVDVGDMLDFTANATPLGTDEVPQDNTFVLNQEVMGSFNANNIICIEGEMESPDMIGEYLHYVVNFENTGNANADFVVVTTEINPAEYDINTLQILNSSHNMQVRVTGNIIEFLFDNINLAAADHGNILFKLKSNNGLQQGDNVINSAAIYFDYNQPVATNDAITQFGTLSVNGFEIDSSVKVYPSPSNGIVNITADSDINSIELYDIQGRLLQSVIVNQASVKLDITQRAAGMYFVKVKTEKGVKVEKIVKK